MHATRCIITAVKLLKFAENMIQIYSYEELSKH